MKMPSSTKININDVIGERTMVVEIEGLTKFRIHLIIARALIWLACLVMGFGGLEFKDDRGAA